MSKDKFLIAAHCALKAGESAIVRCLHPILNCSFVLGESSTFRCSESVQTDFPVKGQLIHPYYTDKEDINPFEHALLQIDSDFVDFEPALLPKNDDEMYSLMEEGACVAFGYGRSFDGHGLYFRGGPVLVIPDRSLGFEMVQITRRSHFKVQGGDSGGGVFCRNNNYENPDQWIRIATISHGGSDIGVAAPLSLPIVNWIKEHLETELSPILTELEHYRKLLIETSRQIDILREQIKQLKESQNSNQGRSLSTDRR